jgi:hypothetical protein
VIISCQNFLNFFKIWKLGEKELNVAVKLRAPVYCELFRIPRSPKHK